MPTPEEIGARIADVISEVTAVAEKLAPIAAAAFPGAGGILSVVKIATAIGIGLANAEPSALAAYEEIEAIADGGGAPSPGQWKEWNAAADRAHAKLQAALAP